MKDNFTVLKKYIFGKYSMLSLRRSSIDIHSSLMLTLWNMYVWMSFSVTEVKLTLNP